MWWNFPVRSGLDWLQNSGSEIEKVVLATAVSKAEDSTPTLE
jgi:hypothetical protein